MCKGSSEGGEEGKTQLLMQVQVIWVDSGWDGLSLADLVTPAQVKKAYLDLFLSFLLALLLFTFLVLFGERKYLFPY